MSTYTYPRPGLGNVGSFQVSGIPFLTSSLSVTSAVMEVDFPQVTKFITITNNGTTNDLQFGFSENGLNGTNYATLKAGDSYTGELKVTKIFLKSASGTTASIIAGLTNVGVNEISNNWSGSVGVG